MNMQPNVTCRQSLTDRTQSLLLVNSIGEFELADGDLENICGASLSGTSLLSEIDILSGGDTLNNASIVSNSSLDIGSLGSIDPQTYYQGLDNCPQNIR